MTRWTADSMVYATVLFIAVTWLGWETTVRVGHVRAMVRDWRHRRYAQSRSRVFADYGIVYQVGSPPGVRP
jgi:hypothetical protein